MTFVRKELSRTERTEPVHETNIIPPASRANSSHQRTSDAKDVLPSSVSQMIPAEDCETLPNTSQQVKYELLPPNLTRMRRDWGMPENLKYIVGCYHGIS